MIWSLFFPAGESVICFATAAHSASSAITFRSPSVDDGPTIRRLVAESKTLDENSTYAYLLICRDFAATSIVASADDQVVGFVIGYRRPERDDSLFVWQVCVSKAYRKQGIARRMLEHLIRSQAQPIATVEATVSPSNLSSRRLFESIANEFDAAISESPCFLAEHFGAETHEDEPLISIGPII